MAAATCVCTSATTLREPSSFAMYLHPAPVTQLVQMPHTKFMQFVKPQDRAELVFNQRFSVIPILTGSKTPFAKSNQN
jgi:hypothetical protein